jgi:hypothetical protein
MSEEAPLKKVKSLLDSLSYFELSVVRIQASAEMETRRRTFRDEATRKLRALCGDDNASFADLYGYPSYHANYVTVKDKDEFGIFSGIASKNGGPTFRATVDKVVCCVLTDDEKARLVEELKRWDSVCAIRDEYLAQINQE